MLHQGNLPPLPFLGSSCCCLVLKAHLSWYGWAVVQAPRLHQTWTLMTFLGNGEILMDFADWGGDSWPVSSSMGRNLIFGAWFHLCSTSVPCSSMSESGRNITWLILMLIGVAFLRNSDCENPRNPLRYDRSSPCQLDVRAGPVCYQNSSLFWLVGTGGHFSIIPIYIYTYIHIYTYIYIYWECHPPNWRPHIDFRGVACQPFPYIGNVILPIDDLIFFRGVACQPPNSFAFCSSDMVLPRNLILIDWIFLPFLSFSTSQWSGQANTSLR